MQNMECFFSEVTSFDSVLASLTGNALHFCDGKYIDRYSIDFDFKFANCICMTYRSTSKNKKYICIFTTDLQI